jgi:hypothetical protein
MKLDITSITLIVIAVVIFLYLVFGNSYNSKSIHNSGALDSAVYADEDASYDSESGYDESSISDSTVSRMVGKNSALRNGGDYVYSSYSQGTRGNPTQDGLSAYFEPNSPTGTASNNAYVAINTDVDPTGSTPLNGNYEGIAGTGDQFASYVPTGTDANEYNSEELLPSESNTDWFDTYNNVSVKNQHLINIYRPLGANTVSGTNRNPTHDWRGEPSNPRHYTGPWNQSTMDPDPYGMGLCKSR